MLLFATADMLHKIYPFRNSLNTVINIYNSVLIPKNSELHV